MSPNWVFFTGRIDKLRLSWKKTSLTLIKFKCFILIWTLKLLQIQIIFRIKNKCNSWKALISIKWHCLVRKKHTFEKRIEDGHLHVQETIHCNINPASLEHRLAPPPAIFTLSFIRCSTAWKPHVLPGAFPLAQSMRMFLSLRVKAEGLNVQDRDFSMRAWTSVSEDP